MPLFTVPSSSHCAPGRRMGKGLGEREAAILYTTKEKGKLLYSITTCYFKRVSSP